ncbi:hypothetical protein DP804_19680 [Salmonella enterica subsp. enterica]|nr:hypothetical protein [Salmonella enterica subsp. enterica serovar Virchow]
MEYSTRIHDKWLSVYRHQGNTETALFAVNLTDLRKSSLLTTGPSLCLVRHSGTTITLYTGHDDDISAILRAVLGTYDNWYEHLVSRWSRRFSAPLILIVFILVLVMGLRVMTFLNTPRALPPVATLQSSLPGHKGTEMQRPPVPRKLTAMPTMPTQNGTPHPLVPVAQSSDIRDVLARNLHNAAARQQFTVTLSTGHERTLYVFADPECHNCRIFEPAVQALSQYFNIEVFPVSLIGKEDTAREVVPVLCAPAPARQVLWRNLFDIGAGMLTLGKDNADSASQPATCDTGTEALALNDKAFAVYHLPGTPTVIADDGRQVPFTAMKTVSTLNAFLAQR